MKARKKAGGRRRDESRPVDTPVGALGEKDTIMHYNAVMLEDLKSKMDFVIEFMQAFRLDVDQKIQELNDKIDDVEARLTLRISKMTIRLDDHEARLATLESRH